MPKIFLYLTQTTINLSTSVKDSDLRDHCMDHAPLVLSIVSRQRENDPKL